MFPEEKKYRINNIEINFLSAECFLLHFCKRQPQEPNGDILAKSGYLCESSFSASKSLLLEAHYLSTELNLQPNCNLSPLCICIPILSSR